MKKSEVEILTTKDLNIFKFQTGNRKLNTSNIKDLKSKIKNKNLLKYHPLIITEDFQIIDGQHRLQVAKDEGLEVSFIIVPDENSIETTRVINTAGRKWTMDDFLESYAESGNEQYVWMKNMKKTYSMFSTPKMLYMATNGKCKPKDFKEGNFTCADKFMFHVISKRLVDFMEVSKILAVHSHFVRAITEITFNSIDYDNSRLVDKVLQHRREFDNLPASHEAIIDMIERVYNHKLRNRISFR